MTEQKNIVEFGLSNCWYAPITSQTETETVYGEPVRLPGMVELALTPKGDLIEFEADNITYFVSQNNQGYEGTLTIALIPDQFKVDCLGEVLHDTDKVMTEVADAISQPFALMFQFEGDKKAIRHVLYHCTANRPTQSGKTKGNGEPNTQQLSFRATPRLKDNIIKRKTTETTPQNTYDNWFKKPFDPVG